MAPSQILQSWPEVLMTATAFLLLVVYHLHLYRIVRKHPLETSLGITNHVRRKWVESVMHEKRDIMAVQTMRNLVMAANFLASTAILISLGLLSFAFQPGLYAEITHAWYLQGAPSETLWIFKLLILAMLFFSAFFNFTLAIRYYNHAGLMINISESHDPDITAASVAEVFNHGALHYTMGMRGYYLSIPMVLWLFGPLWMLGGTFALVAILYRLDREA